MNADKFGNPLAQGLPYARGRILASTEDDFRKMEHAWDIMAERINRHGPDSIYIFTGLERWLMVEERDVKFLNDELAPALYFKKFRELAVAHGGGTPALHDAALLNRVTAAMLAAHMAFAKTGDVVVGMSPSHSHASVVRAARQVGARFVDTADVDRLPEIFEQKGRVALLVLTRLAVTYDYLAPDVVRRAVEIAHRHGTPVVMDDAGGARVGPAILDQPKTLEFGVDAGITGMDKYGFPGPRLGLVVGTKAAVARIRARGFEFGMEARPLLYPAATRALENYRPARVRELFESNLRLTEAFRAVFGKRLHETPVTAQFLAEDILEMAMERGKVAAPPIVPYEAAAALAMLLLRDYGFLSLHFAGVPLGTSTLTFKFIPPETLARFGGPQAAAQAVSASLDKLGALLREPDGVRRLLLGD